MRSMKMQTRSPGLIPRSTRNFANPFEWALRSSNVYVRRLPPNPSQTSASLSPFPRAQTRSEQMAPMFRISPSRQPSTSFAMLQSKPFRRSS